jgi:hypothetical protein
MKETKIDFWGYVLIISLFTMLTIGGYISYKSIDYKILTKLESQKLILPTEIPFNPATPSAQASPSAATSSP